MIFGRNLQIGIVFWFAVLLLKMVLLHEIVRGKEFFPPMEEKFRDCIFQGVQINLRIIVETENSL